MSNNRNTFTLSSRLFEKRKRVIEHLQQLNMKEGKSEYPSSRQQKAQLQEDKNKCYTNPPSIVEEYQQFQIIGENISPKINENIDNKMAKPEARQFFNLRNQSRNKTHCHTQIQTENKTMLQVQKEQKERYYLSPPKSFDTSSCLNINQLSSRVASANKKQVQKMNHDRVISSQQNIGRSMQHIKLPYYDSRIVVSNLEDPLSPVSFQRTHKKQDEKISAQKTKTDATYSKQNPSNKPPKIQVFNEAQNLPQKNRQSRNLTKIQFKLMESYKPCERRNSISNNQLRNYFDNKVANLLNLQNQDGRNLLPVIQQERSQSSAKILQKSDIKSSLPSEFDLSKKTPLDPIVQKAPLMNKYMKQEQKSSLKKYNEDQQSNNVRQKMDQDFRSKHISSSISSINKKVMSSIDSPFNNMRSTFQAEPFLADEENFDIDLKKINNKQPSSKQHAQTKQKPTQKKDCKQLHDDEDLEDFQHYVQFKKENNKDHFKKFDELENYENYDIKDNLVKKQFREDLRVESNPYLDSTAIGTSQYVSCQSVDSPIYGQSICDPTNETPIIRPTKQLNKWWEYKNNDSQSMTLFTNLNLDQKKGFKGNFRTSAGLTKLQALQGSQPQILEGTDQMHAKLSKKPRYLQDQIAKKEVKELRIERIKQSRLLNGPIGHIESKVRSIDKVRSFLVQPKPSRQSKRSSQPNSSRRIKYEPAICEKELVTSDSDDDYYQEVEEEDESIYEKSSYYYEYTDQSVTEGEDASPLY